MEKLTVDRIEGEFAICERSDSTMVEVALSQLPAQTVEGCILVSDGEAFSLDEDEEKLQKQRIHNKMDSLFTD